VAHGLLLLWEHCVRDYWLWRGLCLIVAEYALSCVLCPVSCVLCPVSCVLCPVSRVLCPVSCVLVCCQAVLLQCVEGLFSSNHVLVYPHAHIDALCHICTNHCGMLCPAARLSALLSCWARPQAASRRHRALVSRRQGPRPLPSTSCPALPSPSRFASLGVNAAD
jgi:hypothetical protein